MLRAVRVRGCNFDLLGFSSHNISSPVTLDLCCFFCAIFYVETLLRCSVCTCPCFCKENHIYFHYFCRQITWFWLYFSIYILYDLFNPPPPPNSNYVTWKDKESWHKTQHRICIVLFWRRQTYEGLIFFLGETWDPPCPRRCSETWIITHFERLTNLESVLWRAILFLMFV